MYSYRMPPQISGFGNIKSSYGQFELFAGVITVLQFLAMILGAERGGAGGA